jgi:tetratricopeptide (TPR) repeat protein
MNLVEPERPAMLKDRQSNPVSGATPEAVAHYDDALRAFNIYRGDPIGSLDAAIAAAPDFAQAHLLKACILALTTEPACVVDAARIAAAVRPLAMNDRERSQLAILDDLIAGQWSAAASGMDFHNMRHPLDLAALQCGHLMDFFRGSARDLRDRVARALPAWSADVPGYHSVLGFHAFGLEESGDYARAEEAGRKAIDLEPLDCWAHHAVAHVMEMQGRAEDGIGWMVARQPHWDGDTNFFKVHNWWHRALCHLDLGQMDQVWLLYDGPIRGTKSPVAMDLVDASSLLWRISLAGNDAGGRWSELADAWDAHADGRLYPFNDAHAAMAYLGAGRESAVARLTAAQAEAAAGDTDVASWIRQVGRPLVDGLAAFARGQYAAAVEVLHPVRFVAQQFGGSHAQRDVIDWTLTEAAIRGGMRDVALALSNERLALKPHSPVNRDFVRRAAAVSAVEVAL